MLVGFQKQSRRAMKKASAKRTGGLGFRGALTQNLDIDGSLVMVCPCGPERMPRQSKTLKVQSLPI